MSQRNAACSLPRVFAVSTLSWWESTLLWLLTAFVSSSYPCENNCFLKHAMCLALIQWFSHKLCDSSTLSRPFGNWEELGLHLDSLTTTLFWLFFWPQTNSGLNNDFIFAEQSFLTTFFYQLKGNMWYGYIDKITMMVRGGLCCGFIVWHILC